MNEYPQWMKRLSDIDRERKQEAARLVNLEAKAAAAHQRLLGAALAEVLAFVLAVAVPAPETNAVELDGIKFWIDEYDIEPITARADDNFPTEWRFTLHCKPVYPTIQKMDPFSRTFSSMSGNDWHTDQMGDLAAYVLKAHHQMSLFTAGTERTVADLFNDMKRADALRAAAVVEDIWIDYEMKQDDFALKVLSVLLDTPRGPDDVQIVCTFLLDHPAA